MSRKRYECFRCRDSGFPITMVYLTGKDEEGKTIQLEENGSKHTHKIKEQKQQESQQQQPQQQQSSTIVTEPTSIKICIIVRGYIKRVKRLL
jgi:hypothetical protein